MPKINKKKEITGMTVHSVSSLQKEFMDIIKEEKVSVQDAVRVSSTNIAKHLKLEQKGEIKEGKDADLLILKGGDALKKKNENNLNSKEEIL